MEDVIKCNMTVTLFSLSPVLQASVGMDDLKASWFEHSSSSQLFAPVYFVRPFKSNDKFVVMCWIFIFYTKCSLSAYFISIPFCCAQCNLVEFKEAFLDVKPNHTWCSVGAPIDWVDHFGIKAFRPGSLDYLDWMAQISLIKLPQNWWSYLIYSSHTYWRLLTVSCGIWPG